MLCRRGALSIPWPRAWRKEGEPRAGGLAARGTGGHTSTGRTRKCSCGSTNHSSQPNDIRARIPHRFSDFLRVFLASRAQRARDPWCPPFTSPHRLWLSRDFVPARTQSRRPTPVLPATRHRALLLLPAHPQACCRRALRFETSLERRPVAPRSIARTLRGRERRVGRSVQATRTPVRRKPTRRGPGLATEPRRGPRAV